MSNRETFPITNPVESQGESLDHTLNVEIPRVLEKPSIPPVEDPLALLDRIEQTADTIDEPLLPTETQPKGATVHSSTPTNNPAIKAQSSETIQQVEKLPSARQLSKVYWKRRNAYKKEERKLNEEDRSMFRLAFTSFGLGEKECDSIVDSWFENGLGIGASLKVMAAIEKAEPGSVALLHKEYGIRIFSRYTPQQLIAQSRGQIGVPPQVILTAVSDTNGAFNEVGKTDKKLRMPEGAVFMESDSLVESARRIVRVSKRHGPITRLVVAAHGEHRKVTLGSVESTGEITQNQIVDSRGITRLVERRILDPGCEVILRSCSTGYKGGIGQTLAKKIGLTVFAPNFPSYGVRRSWLTGRVKFGKRRGLDTSKVYKPE
ncbi:MAG TPA: hypothetical protein PKB09_00105 [Candidatus Saccharibacteria bacterium]|nr:hypothetical protein [Candidatus Saccharibacteria bacterium]